MISHAIFTNAQSNFSVCLAEYRPPKHGPYGLTGHEASVPASRFWHCNIELGTIWSQLYQICCSWSYL